MVSILTTLTKGYAHIVMRIPAGCEPLCAGGTVVVHLSLTTVTKVQFRLRAVI